MAEVALEGVTKVFEDGDERIVAVDGLDLEIADGEFLVLVGPSGCGKSTTLRMIAGLETVTEGDIRLGSQVITGKSPQERDIAMVFQSYALYPHMTVRENMSFGLEETTDLPQAEIDERVERTAEMLGIDDLADRKPADLSGGQQQRVALGRAIVREPDVFLLDEPLANLDAKLRAQMRTELQQLQDDLATTTIYVTHDQTEAMTMSDRLAILDGGTLMQVGTPMECYYRPTNRFVAGFIGEPSMNFFDATLDGDRLDATQFAYELPASIRDGLEDGGEYTIGIRPESVVILDSPDGPNDFAAVVDVVEPHGSQNTVHLEFAGQQRSDPMLTVTVDGMRDLDAGDDVTVRLPEDAIHLFDRSTGQALHNRSTAEPGAIPTDGS